MEVKKILAKAHGVLRLHILLFLNCGMTQQDISDLHPSEVDWDGGGSHDDAPRPRKGDRRRGRLQVVERDIHTAQAVRAS